MAGFLPAFLGHWGWLWFLLGILFVLVVRYGPQFLLELLDAILD